MISTPETSRIRSLGAWMAIRGGLAVVFGIVTVFWPREQIGSPTNLNISVPVVDTILIVYLLLHGVLVALQGLKSTAEERTPLLGQAVVVIPGIVFLLMAEMPGQLRAAVAVWAILHGLLELWIWRQRRDERMNSDFLIAGGIHVALGLIVLFGNHLNALSVLGFTGAAAMIAGVFYLVGGYSRRSRKQDDMLDDRLDGRTDGHKDDRLEDQSAHNRHDDWEAEEE